MREEFVNTLMDIVSLADRVNTNIDRTIVSLNEVVDYIDYRKQLDGSDKLKVTMLNKIEECNEIIQQANLMKNTANELIITIAKSEIEYENEVIIRGDILILSQQAYELNSRFKRVAGFMSGVTSAIVYFESGTNK